MKKVVTIGGGTGSFTLLSAIKNIEDIEIKGLVAMTDDGGSTGQLRDELGVLPAGDVRQCLIALAEESMTLRKLMSYRFEEGSLSGHNFGNIFLAGLEKVAGDFNSAVEVLGHILKIKGEVIPVLDKKATLCLRKSDGTILKGENQINHADLGSDARKEVFIEGDVSISKRASLSIENADYIFIGPGNQYCSILPALATKGTKEAFALSKAKIVYIANLTNKKGHSLHNKLSAYVSEVEESIGKPFDYILWNSALVSSEQKEYYELSEGDGVLIESDMIGDSRIIEKDLLSLSINKQDKNDKIADTRSFIRHDIEKLGKAVEGVLGSM